MGGTECSVLGQANVPPGRRIALPVPLSTPLPRISRRPSHRVSSAMAAEAEQGFRPLDEASLVAYINATPALASRLGGAGGLDSIEIKEVGDGNLNFVYIVNRFLAPLSSPLFGSHSRRRTRAPRTARPDLVLACWAKWNAGAPVRALRRDSWPMTRERAYFEASTLREHGRLCPEHTPEVYHFDRAMSLMGMRYIEPPHIILRKGLIAGVEYPLLAEHMSDYMAKTLFFTSLLYNNTTDHKQRGELLLCLLAHNYPGRRCRLQRLVLDVVVVVICRRTKSVSLSQASRPPFLLADREYSVQNQYPVAAPAAMAAEALHGFRPLDEASLVAYIKATPALASRLGGGGLDSLEINEVGDGNLNFVYIVNRSGSSSPRLAPVARTRTARLDHSSERTQGLPYVRLVGDSWPMSRERAYFEASTLREHGRLCPEHTPEVYHFDRAMSLMGMRYIESPHIILRKGLIAGVEYPLLADHMSDYMAKTLFFTSLLYNNTTDHKNGGQLLRYFTCPGPLI
ncbi:hypothetical protein HU200_006593 [Digitaria exilis]|uniref:S-methyl-5-thioribose kinase n=1 Tax=Digitaria exilis TaxID=1010633 RepID=A0A835FPM1_9POAL|nr:hypothetical protein HU200_006593 [Digitaria exilis]